VDGCTHAGIYVDKVVDCVLPDAGFSGRLYDFRINGKRFERSRLLPFSTYDLHAKQYTTIFGPSYYHPDKVVYGSSVQTVSAALQRVDGLRENDEALCENNKILSPGRNRRLGRFVNSYYDQVKSNLDPRMVGLSDSLLETIKCALDPTHQKVALRTAAIKKLVATADMLNGLFNENKNGTPNVTGKIKIPEFAKVGKKARLIGDFSTEGSLIACFLVPLLKYAFSQEFEVGDDSIVVFCQSTRASEIDALFTRAENSDKNYFIFFSDDMACKLTLNGETKWYNLDISSCDASNGQPVFDRVAWFYDLDTQSHDLINRACRQCSDSTLSILHPCGMGNVKERITAKCSSPIEFSGTSLTTLLNNVASSGIACSIIYHLKRWDTSNVDQFLTRCASAVGYAITIDHCASPEDVQFLKMSFTKVFPPSGGAYMQSWTNLGPLLRGAGTCFNDLPYARKLGETLKDAARMRNYQTLLGFKHSGRSCVQLSMESSPGYKKPVGRYKALITKTERDNKHRVYLQSDVQRLPVPDTSLLARYRITQLELDSFTALIRKGDVGDILSHRVSSAILAKDYAYSEDYVKTR